MPKKPRDRELVALALAVVATIPLTLATLGAIAFGTVAAIVRKLGG